MITLFWIVNRIISSQFFLLSSALTSSTYQEHDYSYARDFDTRAHRYTYSHISEKLALSTWCIWPEQKTQMTFSQSTTRGNIKESQRVSRVKGFQKLLQKRKMKPSVRFALLTLAIMRLVRDSRRKSPSHARCRWTTEDNSITSTDTKENLYF